MKRILWFILIVVVAIPVSWAQNPVIRDQFTADPTARVFGDSIYLYPSHDIHWGPGKGRVGWFVMEDYHVFSSADLNHWTDHGVIVSQNKVPWADSTAYSMWAPDCVFRNGKYYFYFPTKPRDTAGGKGFAIGVAVSDSPTGPFVPQDQAIQGVHGIDPNVFIDKDGQAYLYWAEGNLYGAKLSADMLELASEPRVLGDLPEKGLKEGPFLFERNGIYYLTYPHVANKTERLEYATGNNPLGPFTFGGVIMDESPTGCWTNHHSLIDYKGQWYLFYHHNDLSPDFDKNRSVRVDSLFFNADGTIRKVQPTLRGVGATRAWEHIQVDRYSSLSDKGASIHFLDTADRFLGWSLDLNGPDAWARYNTVDFGTKPLSWLYVRAMAAQGATLEVFADGRLLGSFAIPPGDGWRVFQFPFKKFYPGIHDLRIESSGAVKVDWLSFTSKPIGAENPIIDADVPDLSMIRVGDVYYMSSTTMHMSPGVPIMRSRDLVNWQSINYAYDRLDETGELNLENGKSTYGRGSWASSLRYHNGQFYVSTFSGTTGKTYIYTTKDIGKGPWKAVSFKPSLHDHSLFFDDDDKVYMIYGGGKLMLAELSDDLSGIKPGTTPKVIIENASAVAGSNIGLPAEGSQLFKIDGKYYLFNITWPKGGMRTVVIHRADKLTGPWEGRVALQDRGVAQGGLISTPQGKWYAYLFRDYGSVGRVPYLVPVHWQAGWPVLGVEGKVPDTLDLPPSRGLDPGIVASDEFDHGPALSFVWQWNHNPDSSYWSLTTAPGFLRLTTGRVDTNLLLARNTLTQRTFGPQCIGITSIDVSGMRDGDCAGLLLLQQRYGWVGVKATNGGRSVVMVNAQTGTPVEVASVPLTQPTIYLKAHCDFRDRTDKADFAYSLDGRVWIPIGPVLQMAYTLPHFMGYRFGLFNYATRTPGGHVDFDYFRIVE